MEVLLKTNVGLFFFIPTHNLWGYPVCIRQIIGLVSGRMKCHSKKKMNIKKCSCWVFINFLSTLISWLIKCQTIISGKSCLPAFSMGKNNMINTLPVLRGTSQCWWWWQGTPGPRYRSTTWICNFFSFFIIVILTEDCKTSNSSSSCI